MVTPLPETFRLPWACEADVIVDYVNHKVTFEKAEPYWKYVLEVYLFTAVLGLFMFFVVLRTLLWAMSLDAAYIIFSPFIIQLFVGYVLLAPLSAIYPGPTSFSFIPRLRERWYSQHTKRARKTYTIENPTHILLQGIHSLLDIEYEGECADIVTKAELRKGKPRWNLEIFFSKPSLGTVTIKEY
jgi:hypothetical protein